MERDSFTNTIRLFGRDSELTRYDFEIVGVRAIIRKSTVSMETTS